MSHISSDPAPVSPHARSLAGLDLYAAADLAVSVEAAREVIVVVSRSRDPEREIDTLRCHHDRVPIVVRPSGGGAVVLAPGVVAASVVALAADERFPDSQFRRFNTAVTRALATVGVGGVELRGTSDLCLGDRKIAGSSLRLYRNLVLFQLALLVSPDLSLLDRYLRHPSREPAYRRGRTHRDFVTSLAEAGHITEPSSLISTLEDAFRTELVPAKSRR